MVKFFCRIYKKAIDIVCVVVLIIGTLYGFICFGNMGGNFYSGFNFGAAFLGGILSFAITFLGLMFTIPPLMVLFSIDGRLENIEKKMNIEKEDI